MSRAECHCVLESLLWVEVESAKTRVEGHPPREASPIAAHAFLASSRRATPARGYVYHFLEERSLTSYIRPTNRPVAFASGN